MVFMMFWGGVDWKTGLPLDPGKLSGYESNADLMLRDGWPLGVGGNGLERLVR
jgi:hypothetical protein